MTRHSRVSLNAILTAVFAGFLIAAALIAAVAAAQLLARGTPLSGMWDSRESAYRQLLGHRLIYGAGMTLLAVTLSFAAVGRTRPPRPPRPPSSARP